MFGKKNENDRFVIERASSDRTLATYILTDKVTGNQYLANWISTGGGLTPLLDENGNISKSDRYPE